MADASKALQAKLAAWRRQHAALDAPAYRLTMKARRPELKNFNHGKARGSGGSERFYSADDVERLLAYLSRQNARGYDIYITPIDSGHHYLVVDDMTPDSQDRLTADGYRPALIQESSEGNRQAILKTPRRDDHRGEQSVANRLVIELNQKYGDAAFSGVIHPFRLAGFSNKKEGRGNAFTRVLEASGGLCPRAVARLDEIRAEIAESAERLALDHPETGSRHDDPSEAETPAPKSDVSMRYAQLVRQWRGLVREQGWDEDLSRVDWQVCLAMLREGWDPDQVRGSLLQASPGIWERHHNPADYARRTVDRAVLFLVNLAPHGGGQDQGTADELDDFFRSGPGSAPDSEPR